MGTATTKEHKRVDIRRNDTVKVMTGRDREKNIACCACFPTKARCWWNT